MSLRWCFCVCRQTTTTTWVVLSPPKRVCHFGIDNHDVRYYAFRLLDSFLSPSPCTFFSKFSVCFIFILIRTHFTKLQNTIANTSTISSRSNRYLKSSETIVQVKILIQYRCYEKHGAIRLYAYKLIGFRSNFRGIIRLLTLQKYFVSNQVFTISNCSNRHNLMLKLKSNAISAMQCHGNRQRNGTDTIDAVWSLIPVKSQFV